MNINIRSMLSLETNLLAKITLILCICGFQAKGQTILIDPNGDGGFENGPSFSANGWTEVNGSATNKWFMGNAGGTISGPNKAYISSDNGLSNTYNNTIASRVHLYRDITFPANEAAITLTFKWQAQGESLWDFLLVCAMPVSQTPVANIPSTLSWGDIPVSYPGTIILSNPPNLNAQGTVQTQVVHLPANFAGTTQRLVFIWTNDGAGGLTPAASIDSISLVSRPGTTISSIASGNYSNPLTWLNGTIPTPGDSVVVNSGHTISLDAAASISVNYLKVNGTLDFSPTTTTLSVRGDLFISAGGSLKAFNNTNGKKLQVGGDITNNGMMNLAKAGALLTLNGTGTQTVGGSGVLDSSGIIAALTFNNTAAQPIINWNWQHTTIASGSLTFNGGWVTMGPANSVTVGNGAPVSINLTSGGFTDGTVKRWFNTTGLGTIISPGFVPNFSDGSYPFISGSPATGYSPAYFHRAMAALTTSGTLNVTFNGNAGLNALGTPVSENGYTVSKQTNTTWTVSTGATYASSTDHVFSVQGQGLYGAITANVRLLKNSGFTGTHQAGSNLPLAQRSAIPPASITGVYTMGIDSVEEPSFTVASGAWNNPAIWSNGIPSCGKAAEIRATDSVWVTASTPLINISHLSVKGSLAITGSTVNIGCMNNNSITQVFGKLFLSGGNLNINGSFRVEPNAFFSHTGGNINIDGNAGGNITGSVASGTPIVSIASSNIVLSGGVFTLVDPHTGTVSAANNIAFMYTGIGSVNNTTGWTLKFGNGVSTDAGGALATPVGFLMNMGGGKIVIDSLVIDAGITRTNRFATLTNSTPFGCNQLLITNNGDARTASSTVYVSKNVVNNGTLVTGVLYLGTYLNATAGTSSFAQTISGTGYFKNNAATPTANFSQLLINNINPAGVVFADRNALRSNSNIGTVSTVFTIGRGFINTLNDTFVLGVSAASTGSLTHSVDSAGFVLGSTFSRWWGTAVGGSTITSGQIPNTANGAYPFITTPGTGTKISSRTLWLRQTTASTTGGIISVKYTDSMGMNAVSIADGSYTIDKKSKAKWIVSYTGIAGSPLYSASINGAGFYVPSNSNSRIVGATTALSGTHQGGTILPNAQRTGIALTDLNNTWFMGLNNADTAVSTIASGNWNDPLTWSGGSIPTCNDYVVILPGHTMNINAANANARGVNITSGGVLTIADSSLTIGCSLNNASLIVSGTLNVTGGTVNLNGYLSIQTNATFSQSGGYINIDGNAAGNIANSVPSGTPIVNIPTSTVTLSGGLFTIIDPHAGTTSATGNIAFSYTGSQVINNTTGWTLKFGNGISTDAGGALTSPVGFLMNIAGSRIIIDSLVIDAGLSGVNRFSTFHNGSTLFGLNNLYITGNGDARIGNTAYVAKNIVNNGNLTTSGTLYLGTFLGSTIGTSTFAQTISGTGSFKNNNTTSTANFTNLTINNTNTTGVIFANQNSMRSNTNTGTVSGTFTITKGLVNTSNDTFTLGISPTSLGTFNFSNDSGNFTAGSTFGRWWGTAAGGANIVGGQVPNSVLGAYPFTSVSGTKTVNRILWLKQNSVSTTGGRINVKYIEGAGLIQASINDGSYVIDSVSNAKWILSYNNITGTPTYSASINGAGIYLPSNLNSRIAGVAAALSGTHQPGTTLPNVQRSGITLSDLNKTWNIGINNADIVNQTIASGNWNDTSIWSKRTIPTCIDSILILPGHNVLISTANASARGIVISAGGALTIAGNSLTVGCTNNNAFVIVNGTLTVTGGDLNINGSLKIADGAIFNQSDGNITVDGNAGGNALNSVPAGTNILDIRSYLINWTGGVLTLVDPHVQSSSSYAFYYNNNAASVDASIAHTFAFGNGISTDPTNNVFGFYVNNRGDINATRINFGNVILKGTTNSFENRKVSSLYNLIARGNFIIDYGGILETTNTLKVGGNITVNTGGKLIAQYITLALGSGNGSESPSTVLQTISGGGILSSNSITPLASTQDLTVNNISAGGVVITRPFIINSNLNLINGIIHTTAADSFQFAGNATGGSNTSYIDGPCYRKFNASRNATGTYNSTTFIPLGKNGRHLPIWIDPSTAPSGSILLKSEVFDNTNSANGALSISPYIWETRVVRDSVNFNGAYLQLSDTAATLTDSTRILYTSTANGSFSVAPAANIYTPGATKRLSTSGKIPAPEFNGFVTYGRLTPCFAPLSQPTSFVASNIQGTAFDASFTAASGSPTNYLVVRYPSGATATAPVNQTNYIIGSPLGTGTIVYKQNGTAFTQSNLPLNTAYDYYVYSFNNSECHGPLYNTTAPLFATVATCTSTIPPPAGFIGSNIHIRSFGIKWNKSSIPGATYSVDISTTNNFSSYLPGYQSVLISDTFVNIAAASPFTNYYIRVKTISGTCSSSLSSTAAVKTLCDSASIPYTLNFESALTCNKAEKIGSGNNWGIINNPGSGFTNRTLTYNYALSYDANAWYYTQALHLTAGVQYRISFRYGTNSPNNLNNNTVQKLAIRYGGAPESTSMNDTITILPFINNTSSRTFVADFSPATSGFFFVGINCYSSKGMSNLFVDDIKLDFVSSLCKTPEELNVSGITADSALLRWKKPASIPGGGYLYYIQSNRSVPHPTNETIATGTISGADSSKILTGLIPGKRYNVWMRSVCGADTSTWTSMPASFTTACGLVTSFPWTEDFEDADQPALPLCFSAVNANNDADSFVTYKGVEQAYNQSVSLNTISNNGANDDYLILPPFVLKGGQQLRYAMRSQNNNAYKIVLSTTGKNPADFTTILKPTTLADSYEYIWDSVNLAYYNDTVYIAFQVPPVGSSNGYRFFIDSLIIENLPACVAPTIPTITSLSASSFSAKWQVAFPTPSDGYQWELRLTGAPGSGAVGLISKDSTSADSISISGLAPDSIYTLYIRSNCDSGLYSSWARVTFRTLCGVSNIPYTQNFETVITPNIYRCDKIEKTGLGNNWVTVTNPGSGFTSTALKYGSNASTANAWFYTQGLNLTAGVAYRLKFKYGNSSPLYIEKLIIKYDTSASQTMKDTLGIFTNLSSPGQRSFSKDFVPSVSGIYYIGFNCFSDAGQASLYIDDIIVEHSPCLPPQNILVSGITTSNATMNWSASLSLPDYGYEWEIRSSGNAGSGAAGLATSGTDSSKTLTTSVNILAPNTQYIFYVRSNCGSLLNPWDSVKFITNCLTTTVPYVQDFEAAIVPGIVNCDKLESVGTSGNWKTVNNPTNYFRNKTLIYTPTNSVANAWYYTQGLNLTAGYTYRLRFSYGSSGYSFWEDEKLAVRYGRAATHTAMQDTLALFPSIYAEEWEQYSVDFTPDTTGVYYIGFNCFSDANQTNLYVDNIIVDLIPAMAPSNINVSGITINTATINWSPSAIIPTTGYEWEIRTSGNAGSGSTGLALAGLDSPNIVTKTVAGLTPATRYTVYVRAKYGNEVSGWNSAVFNTLCLATNIPYSENFETPYSWELPICSRIEKIGNSDNWYSSPISPFTSNALTCYADYKGSNAWYYTQGLNLTAGLVYRLKFKYANSSNKTASLGIRYGSASTYTAMNDTLVILPNIHADQIQTRTVDFIPNSTGVYFIGFNCFSAPAQNYMLIDDVSVELSPACIEVKNIATTNITSNSATLSWLAPKVIPGNGYVWEIRTTGAPGSGSAGLITNGTSLTLTANIAGLTTNTQYKAYIRSNCGSGFSAWDSALFMTRCNTYANVPYLQNFESVTAPAIPTCNVIENAGGDYDWTVSANVIYSNMLSLFHNYEFSTGNAWYYTQGINLTAGISYKLKFKFLSGSTANLILKYGTAAEHTAMTNLLSNISLSSYSAFAQNSFEVNFTPAISGVYYIGFNYASDNTHWHSSNLFVDDITVQTENCLPPATITMGTITNDSATLQWISSSSNPGGYEWEVRTTGTGGSGLTGLAASGTSNTLSAIARGLTLGTPYRIYVRSNCGNGLSAWDSLINAVPVKLISFNGEIQNDDVILHWTTASENNNKGFVVERSVDGSSFTEIGFVKGKGDNNTLAKYTKSDELAFVKTASTILYYRLRQQDFDGKESFSQIIKLEQGKNQLLSKPEAHPNPFNNEVNITVESTRKSNYSISITDIQGRLVSTMDVVIHEGLNTIALKDLAHLNAGMYIVKLIGEEQHTIKLVKSN